jgi:ATP-dependent DNA helicase RecQ
VFHNDLLNATLRNSFALQDFRVGQREVVERLMDSKNVAAVFPTGGGKSLCYQLPALLLDGLTVVVSPLMALMREQVDMLVSKGIAAARLDSSLTAEELASTNQAVRNGTIKILYIAPERFFNERFRELIATVPISLFAVDEAHCISQWGHNFRPDYLKLASIAESLKVGAILALTATATPGVLSDIQAGFRIANEDVIQTPFHRKNLSIRFTETKPNKRFELLVDRLKKCPGGATIVYVTLQKTAEELTEKIVQLGVEAKAYHAGMPDEDRQTVQDWFMSNDCAIVVATIAFGMGIDKSNIRYVYHWNISKGLESYAQEIGRAGRDGKPSLCETFVVPDDRTTLENFAYGDTPTLKAVSSLVDLVSHHPNEFYLSYYELANECDIRDLVIRTLLTYLELDGFLQSTGPRYDRYEFKPLVSSATILKGLDVDRRKFASDVLSLTVKKKTWFGLPIPIVCERLGCERRRLVALFEHFSERGWMELKVTGLVHGYRKLQPLADVKNIAKTLYHRLSRLEEQEVCRIDQLFQLATSKTCQASALSRHFGQPMHEDCGACSVCVGHGIVNLPIQSQASMGSSALTQLNAIKNDYPAVLSEPRNRARFLCGLSSPCLVRHRLTRHPLYGCCDHVPFATILAAVQG